MERLQHEFEAIGFYLSAHPLAPTERRCSGSTSCAIADLPALAGRPADQRAKLAGIVIGRQERTSAKGNRFAFVQLSDASGMYEVMVFTERWRRHRELLEPGRPVLVTVDVRMRGGECPADRPGRRRRSTRRSRPGRPPGSRSILSDTGPSPA